MQNQSRDPRQDKSKPSTGSQQQGETSRRDPGQDTNRKTKDKKDVLVNQQEQNKATDTFSTGTSDTQGTGKEKERSFYKNDLPETEEGTDVEEKSPNLRS